MAPSGGAVAETLSHQALKRLAVAWLWRLGCRVLATEVACPIGRYRIDVAGWFDGPLPDLGAEAGGRDATPLWTATGAPRRGRSTRSEEWSTVIVECKQSRADLFRDAATPEAILAERERLERKRADLEERRVKRFEPQLRREGTSLFAELDEWDFAASRLGAYRETLRRIERLEDDLYGQTKFARFARYRLADRLVLFTPAGLARPRELPAGWGLVECDRRPLRRDGARLAARADPAEPLPLRVRVAPPPLVSPVTRRERLFRAIAVAATRASIDSPEPPTPPR
jgi:hypothetical protein